MLDSNNTWNYLIDTIRSERCLLVLGPDALFNPPYETFERQFLDYLVSQNVLESPSSNYDLTQKLFSFETDYLKSEVAIQMELFYNGQAPPEILRKITRIPFHFILSYSPDRLLCRTFEEEGFPFQYNFYTRSGKAQPLSRPTFENPLIHHLYGSVDQSDSIILTYDDLFEFYQSAFQDGVFPINIKDTLRNSKVVLFLGVPFDRWHMNFTTQLLGLRENRKYKEYDMYAIGGVTTPETRQFCERQYSMNFLPMDVPEFVDELYGRLEEANLLRIPPKDSSSLIREVKTLLSKAQLQEAIDLLIDHTKGSNIQDSILLISGRYHNFRREDMNGLIRPDEASIRFNQITQALLVTLDELEDKPLLSDTQSSSNRALENIKQGTRSIQETQLKRRKSVVSQKDRQEIVQLNDGPSSREEKILFSELQSAKELEGTSNWQSALAIYQKLIAQNVNLLGAWKGLVRIYQRLEDIENLAVAVDNVKLLENILAFEENTRKVISLKELKVDHLAFYRQFNWKFQPQMNVLLGRNGYGKSFLLRLVIALLQNEYEITSDYFRNTHRSPSVELKVDRSGESRSIVRDRMLFTEQFGKVPVLAISDLRFLNRSSTSIQRADSKGSDLRENGAYHFLYNQPYSDLIQTFLYELCLEYIDKNHSFNLAIFRLVHSVVQELTDNEFRFHRIERLDNAQFLIEVITEGNSEPLPIQFASQGTLSILAIFGLIYNYLRSLNPNASKQDIPKCSGIVFIDEVDAHLHPTWQQKIVALLKETFPNVQFIITAHNPLVVAGCKENEAAVFRKTSNGFHIHQFERHFIGADMSDMYQTIFETEEKDATYLKYAAMRPFKKQLKGELRQIIEKYLPDEETQKQFHQLNEKIETYLSKLETPPEDNDSILQDALTTNELDQWVDIQKQRQPSKADKEKIDELNEILYYIAEFEEVEAKRKEQRNIRRQQSERKALKAKIDQSKDSADTP